MLDFWASILKGESNDFCERWCKFTPFWRHVLKWNCTFPFNFKRGKHLASRRENDCRFRRTGEEGRPEIIFWEKTFWDKNSEKRWGQLCISFFSRLSSTFITFHLPPLSCSSCDVVVDLDGKKSNTMVKERSSEHSVEPRSALLTFYTTRSL